MVTLKSCCGKGHKKISFQSEGQRQDGLSHKLLNVMTCHDPFKFLYHFVLNVFKATFEMYEMIHTSLQIWPSLYSWACSWLRWVWRCTASAPGATSTLPSTVSTLAWVSPQRKQLWWIASEIPYTAVTALSSDKAPQNIFQMHVWGIAVALVSEYEK